MHSPSASRRDISDGGPGGSASGGGGKGTQPEQCRSSRALGSVRRPTTITEGVAASGGGGKRATGAPTVTGDGGGDANGSGAEQTAPGRSSISSGSIDRFSDAMEEAMEEADRLAEEFLSEFAAAGGDSDAGVVSPMNNGSSSGEDLASDGSGGGNGFGGGGDPLLAVMRSTDSLEGMALR